MTEQEARDGLATGEFTAYGPATTRLYATLDGTQIVSVKTAYDLDRYAGRITDIHTSSDIVIRIVK